MRVLRGVSAQLWEVQNCRVSASLRSQREDLASLAMPKPGKLVNSSYLSADSEVSCALT